MKIVDAMNLNDTIKVAKQVEGAKTGFVSEMIIIRLADTERTSAPTILLECAYKNLKATSGVQGEDNDISHAFALLKGSFLFTAKFEEVCQHRLSAHNPVPVPHVYLYSAGVYGRLNDVAIEQ